MQAASETEKAAQPQAARKAALSCAVETASPRPTWSVRAVGFIAKPEKTDELAICLDGPVNEILQQTPGFAGSIVLRSQTEVRKLLALTFWTSEKQAMTSNWERRRSVRHLIAPTVDVCTKVQIFRAETPECDWAFLRNYSSAEATCDQTER